MGACCSGLLAGGFCYNLDMTSHHRKTTGSYYTPHEAVRSLVRWAIRRESDRLLDPACGDGRFLSLHRTSVGVEQDPVAAANAIQHAPWALIHEGNFFAWASQTTERFECAAGNPPFIRYQRFTGEVRASALQLCDQHGVHFSALTSSWAPFLVAAARLLKPGGRMAFVVPAEIGHAPYAAPLLKHLVDEFDIVHIVAVREKIFPELSEDCWLLYAEGFGGTTDHIRFTELDRFSCMDRPPTRAQHIGLVEWNYWNNRLRPFLLGSDARALYRSIADASMTRRLGDAAKVGIGYVSGNNSFFHLRPSQAKSLEIPRRFLRPTVRNARYLSARAVTDREVKSWIDRDEPVLLLKISPRDALPEAVASYLKTQEARQVQGGYKCRMRDPWFSVPDVTVPDAFLTYMCGAESALVANEAQCTCTNSIHAVALNGTVTLGSLQRAWNRPFTHLSCEVEGHPLGGGMLKLEPREAARVVLSPRFLASQRDVALVEDSLAKMRRWRHYG